MDFIKNCGYVIVGGVINIMKSARRFICQDMLRGCKTYPFRYRRHPVAECQ